MSQILLFKPHKSTTFVEGFTYLPLRAYLTQMAAAIDLVHAWTALNAPRLAPPTGTIVAMAPYRYRSRISG